MQRFLRWAKPKAAGLVLIAFLVCLVRLGYLICTN